MPVLLTSGVDTSAHVQAQRLRHPQRTTGALYLALRSGIQPRLLQLAEAVNCGDVARDVPPVTQRGAGSAHDDGLSKANRTAMSAVADNGWGHNGRLSRDAPMGRSAWNLVVWGMARKTTAGKSVPTPAAQGPASGLMRIFDYRAARLQRLMPAPTAAYPPILQSFGMLWLCVESSRTPTLCPRQP